MGTVASLGGLGLGLARLLASTTYSKTHPYYPFRSIIKSMGLSIQDFNTITRRLAQDPRLRQRVLKQAYLYRLEAKINDRCV